MIASDCLESTPVPDLIPVPPPCVPSDPGGSTTCQPVPPEPNPGSIANLDLSPANLDSVSTTVDLDTESTAGSLVADLPLCVDSEYNYGPDTTVGVLDNPHLGLYSGGPNHPYPGLPPGGPDHLYKDLPFDGPDHPHPGLSSDGPDHPYPGLPSNGSDHPHPGLPSDGPDNYHPGLLSVGPEHPYLGLLFESQDHFCDNQSSLFKENNFPAPVTTDCSHSDQNLEAFAQEHPDANLSLKLTYPDLLIHSVPRNPPERGTCFPQDLCNCTNPGPLAQVLASLDHFGDLPPTPLDVPTGETDKCLDLNPEIHEPLKKPPLIWVSRSLFYTNYPGMEHDQIPSTEETGNISGFWSNGEPCSPGEGPEPTQYGERREPGPPRNTSELYSSGEQSYRSSSKELKSNSPKGEMVSNSHAREQGPREEIEPKPPGDELYPSNIHGETGEPDPPGEEPAQCLPTVKQRSTQRGKDPRWELNSHHVYSSKSLVQNPALTEPDQRLDSWLDTLLYDDLDLSLTEDTEDLQYNRSNPPTGYEPSLSSNLLDSESSNIYPGPHPTLKSTESPLFQERLAKFIENLKDSSTKGKQGFYKNCIS